MLKSTGLPHAFVNSEVWVMPHSNDNPFFHPTTTTKKETTATLKMRRAACHIMSGPSQSSHNASICLKGI